MENSEPINCWCSGYCTIKSKKLYSCSECKDKGFGYLVNKLYLPKTNIPKTYLKDTSEYEYPIEGSYYLSNLINITNAGQGIYCYSNRPGTGKTTLATNALLRYLYYSVRKEPSDIDNRRVYYINTAEFLDRLRKSMNSGDDELELLMSELQDPQVAPKLILLDDIGNEKVSEWVSERLYTLINMRVSNGLATIFTSNLSVDDLGLRLGTRIASRIRGTCKSVQFNGPDHRTCIWR